MIIDIFFVILNWFLSVITYILPVFSIYPQNVLDGFTYFVDCLYKVNFILPIFDILTAILFLINFEIYYYTAKILISIINFFRGTGEIKI